MTTPAKSGIPATTALTNTERSTLATFEGGFDEFRERQVVFELTRRLAEAQFSRGDRQESDRLWQEAATLGIDPDRIVALLYGVDDHRNAEAMDRVDRPYRERLRRRKLRRRWPLDRWSGISRRRGGWHRTAPPEAVPGLRGVH